MYLFQFAAAHPALWHKAFSFACCIAVQFLHHALPLLQAGWKENHATFMCELKNLQASGLTTLGHALRTAFDLLNLNRLVSGIDNYGQVLGTDILLSVLMFSGTWIVGAYSKHFVGFFKLSDIIDVINLYLLRLKNGTSFDIRAIKWSDALCPSALVLF